MLGIFRQLRDIFTRFDMDGDGRLTHLELAVLLRSLGLKPTGDQIYALLAKVDSNGNGSVELDELVEAIILEMTEEVIFNQEQLMEEFQTFYHDGNGFITAVELANPMVSSASQSSLPSWSSLLPTSWAFP